MTRELKDTLLLAFKLCDDWEPKFEYSWGGDQTGWYSKEADLTLRLTDWSLVVNDVYIPTWWWERYWLISQLRSVVVRQTAAKLKAVSQKKLDDLLHKTVGVS